MGLLFPHYIIGYLDVVLFELLASGGVIPISEPYLGLMVINANSNVYRWGRILIACSLNY